jgi:glycosyl transferase, family 25
LSHLSVLRAARDARVERLVILEDDVNFVGNFRGRWQSVATELDTMEWSICYPGHSVGNMSPGLLLLPPENGVLCTHFMMINERAFDSIIEGLESILSRPTGHPLGGPMHVDGAYSVIRRQNPALKTYVFCPTLGYQRRSRTDIHDHRWFDRFSLLQPIVRMVRKTRNAWHG